MSTAWHVLERVLAQRERPVALWWRDDDAGPIHPQLMPMLALAERLQAPLALAVVPARLDRRVAMMIRASSALVLQHGWAHADHARPGARRLELGGTVALARLSEQLVRGREILEQAFGERFLPAMVPPWNRIDREVVLQLPALGFSGLSTFGPRPSDAPAPNLMQINTHLDILDWTREGAFVGGERLLERLSALLRSSGDEPIGILTHHQRMGDDAFAWLERLLTVLRDHPLATLASAARLFREPA